MSWIITSIVVTGLSVDASLKAAKAQQYELDKQAEDEKVAAEGRELQRRERLNKVLAQSALGQSASGIAGEGTPESIALSTAKTASLSEGLESLSDKLKQAQLKRQAKNAKSAGQVQATSLLLKGAVQAGQLDE